MYKGNPIPHKLPYVRMLMDMGLKLGIVGFPVHTRKSRSKTNASMIFECSIFQVQVTVDAGNIHT